MYWLLTSGFERYRVLDRAELCRPDLGERLADLGDFWTARSFLDRIVASPGSSDVLRALLHDELASVDVSRLDDHEVAEALAHRLGCGMIQVAVAPIQHAVDVGFAGEPEAARSSEPPAKETSWVEFAVLDDATGEPVPNVRLSIKLPGAARMDHTTPASGSLDFDPCDAGSCELTADFTGATAGNTLDLVGIGEPSREPLRGAAVPNEGNRPFRLAHVVRHRVRTGDTIAALAERAGMGWKDLAKFNFDTDVPEEINKALRTHVGCSRKTEDGKNYVFDSSDDPGIIYIPQRVERRGIRTGQTHTLRVRRITTPQRPFVFSC